VDERLRELIEADPLQARKLLAQLKETVVVPHEFQRPVVDSPARYKVLNCGRRWGKTKIGVKALVDSVRTQPNALAWWVAPTYKVVKRGYRETMRQLPKQLLASDDFPPESSFDAGRSVVLRLKNGSSIEFYSAERPGGMLGEGVNFAVLDEAATMPATVWEQIVRPTLADKQGAAMLISTPRGRNWFYKRWQMGQDPQEPDWASWTFPSVSNPYLPEAEVEAARRETPALIFDQEWLAKFLASGSSVFRWPESSVEGNRILDNGRVEGIPIKGHVFLGIDLAKTTDFTVLYGADETHSHNVLFERFQAVSWPEQKRRIRRAVALLENEGATAVTLVMDSTGVGDPIVEDLEEDGYDVVGLNFTTYKNKMVSLLAKDLEEGRTFILDQGARTEFENYGMKQTANGRLVYSAPEGEHDDAVSAKMLSHWGLVNEGAPSIQSLGSAVEAPQEREHGEEPQEREDDYSDLLDDEPAEALQAVARPPAPNELLWNDALFR
jgi:hypothetical protein